MILLLDVPEVHKLLIFTAGFHKFWEIITLINSLKIMLALV